MSLLFVYGKLKQGFENHDLLNGAHFFGKGKTKELYTMFVDWGIPFISKERRISSIFGELYLVNDRQLMEIDRLERSPYRSYPRDREQVAVLPLYGWIFPGSNLLLPDSGCLPNMNCKKPITGLRTQLKSNAAFKDERGIESRENNSFSFLSHDAVSAWMYFFPYATPSTFAPFDSNLQADGVFGHI
jgi:gamma-glutamylcyclotransferase (GGCT)/AIG2-like uncharacterized protein YtfP